MTKVKDLDKYATFDVHQIAKIMHRSVKTIKRMEEKGEIIEPNYKNGGLWLWIAQDFWGWFGDYSAKTKIRAEVKNDKNYPFLQGAL